MTEATVKPSKYELWQAQRMIEMGEWLFNYESILELIHSRLAERVCDSMEDDDEECHYMYGIAESEQALCEVLRSMRAMRRSLPEYSKFDGTVYLTNSQACKEHRYSYIVKKEESAEDQQEAA